MAEPATKPCGKCGGSGTVPREVRKMADGQPDPLDFRRRELCEPCGGSGVIRADYAAVRDKAPGYIADQIGLEPSPSPPRSVYRMGQPDYLK